MLSGKLSFHNYKILKKENASSEMSKCHMSKWMKINLPKRNMDENKKNKKKHGMCTIK